MYITHYCILHSVSSVRLVYHVGQMIFYVVVLSWVKLTLKMAFVQVVVWTTKW